MMNKITLRDEKQNVTVLADEAPVFTTTRQTASKYKLRDNCELSDAELETLRHDCLYEDYTRKAFVYLGIRDYSVHGLCRRLGDDAAIAQEVTEKLIEAGN